MPHATAPVEPAALPETGKEVLLGVAVPPSPAPAGATIAAALINVQANLKGARKTKENPHLKSKYADLSEVWEACHEALTKFQVAVIQAPIYHDGLMFCKTTLLHVSGESVVGEYILRPVKDDPQGYGSAFTYARRYSLLGMLGITNEDDDGQRGSTRGPSKAAALDKVKDALGDKTIGVIQQKDLYEAWKKAGRSDESVQDYLKVTLGITATKDIKVKDYPAVLSWVKSSK